MKPEAAVDPRWSWHYRELLRLHDLLEEEAKARQEELGVPLEPHRTHPAERAGSSADREVASGLARAEEAELADVEAALERIRRGRYGICEVTGQTIPPARLRAVPWTRYVREVEELREMEARLEGR
jgi:RNA polymerase-binding transcription factor DksA